MEVEGVAMSAWSWNNALNRITVKLQMKCPVVLIFILVQKGIGVGWCLHLISGCGWTICKYFQPQQDGCLCSHACLCMFVWLLHLLLESFSVD